MTGKAVARCCDRCREETTLKVRVQVFNLPITRSISEKPHMAEICQQCEEDLREVWNAVSLDSNFSCRIPAVQVFGEEMP